MKFPLTVCVFLLTVSSSLSADIAVRGTEGGRVSITCSYPEQYKDSYKYFYKGIYKEYNLILKSDGQNTSPRFSLREDRQSRSFTVTISDLRMDDAGLYTCGTGNFWSSDYKEIHLTVIRAPEKPRPVQISTSSIGPNRNSSTAGSHITSVSLSVTHQTGTGTGTTGTGNTTNEVNRSNTEAHILGFVAGVLGSVLLVLTLCSGTFFILKKRKRKCGTALFQQNVKLNTENDRMYEEIPNSDVAMVTSSSNQTPASHLNNRTNVSAVYATVPKQQRDSNPSTNQVTDPDGDYYSDLKSPEAAQNSRTELIYVTATHPQNISTHESPIYSVIKHT